MAPIKVKNGIESNNSFERMPNTRYGKLAMNCAGKKPNSMAIMPEASPRAANEKATGKPVNRNTIKAINMAGAIHSWLMIIAVAFDTNRSDWRCLAIPEHV